MLPIIDIVAWTNVAAIVQNRLTFVANIAELQQQTPIVWRLPLPIVILWPCYGCLQALAVRMFTFKKCLNFRNRGKTFLSRVASWSVWAAIFIWCRSASDLTMIWQSDRLRRIEKTVVVTKVIRRDSWSSCSDTRSSDDAHIDSRYRRGRTVKTQWFRGLQTSQPLKWNLGKKGLKGL